MWNYRLGGQDGEDGEWLKIILKFIANFSSITTNYPIDSSHIGSSSQLTIISHFLLIISLRKEKIVFLVFNLLGSIPNNRWKPSFLENPIIYANSRSYKIWDFKDFGFTKFTIRPYPHLPALKKFFDNRFPENFISLANQHNFFQINVFFCKV
jgi:hypothetical protein